MKQFKYLKLFEAFESSAIKSVLSYIGDKISKNEKEKFLNHLRNILMESYDFPIDKISDGQVRYISAKKAFEIQVPENYDISNPRGIYALKFWFSIDKGYLGFTGVGKSEDISDTSGEFTNKEMDYIKNNLGLKTGKLIPVTNYSVLKTGDEIVCYFSDYEELSYLALGTIFIEDEKLFGIQDVADGGTPSGDWSRYGRRSWNLGQIDYPADDHSKLHIYRRGSEDLEIVGPDNKELAIDRDGNLTTRRDAYSIKRENLEDVDFAIVLYIDELIGDESVSDIKKLRSEEKKGATALMSDSEIKKLNYQRYLSKIVELYGLTIKTTESELRNLQNMIKSVSCGDMILFALISDNPSIPTTIDRISRNIKSLINSSDQEKSYYLEELSRRFKDQKEESVKFNSRYKGSIERVKDSGDEKTNELIGKMVLLSQKIQKYLTDSKIETLDDLLFIRYKLESIRNFVNEQSSNNFSSGVETIIKNFYYNDGDVNRGAEYASKEQNLDKDIKAVNLMERYIDSILR